MNKEILTKEIENTYNEVVNWRRHLHQYPELSFKEHKTAEYIAKQLNKFGNIEVSHPTETSVMGRLRGKKWCW